MSSPLLFEIREDTYLKAFVFTALTAGLTTGLVLEYRLTDPFSTYTKGATQSMKRSRSAMVVQTGVVAFVAWMFSLVLLHLLFSLGGSLVSLEGGGQLQ